MALVIGVIGAAMAVAVGGQFLIVALIVGFWLISFMPYWRRRVRARARQLADVDAASEVTKALGVDVTYK